jgi:hypothetical protein
LKSDVNEVYSIQPGAANPTGQRLTSLFGDLELDWPLRLSLTKADVQPETADARERSSESVKHGASWAALRSSVGREGPHFL